MKYRKFISFVLCLALLLSCTLPAAYASAPEHADLSNVTISENSALYYYDSTSLRYAIFLNTATGTGSFAGIYLSQQDYLYEYLFTLSVEEIDTSSVMFWDNLITNCFTNAHNRDPLYLPDTITVSNNTNETSTYASSDDFEEYCLDWLEEEYGSPYNMRNIYTGYRGSKILFIYGTLQYYAGRDTSYIVHKTLSVLGFIISVMGLAANPGLIAAIGAIASADGIISAGSELHEYILSASVYRYVRMKDNSHNLEISEKHTTYTGYSMSTTGESHVYKSTEDTVYLPDQSYFNNKEAQIDAGYAYWQRVYG